MVDTFNYGTECPFTNHFLNFVPITDLVALTVPIVPFIIIESVVDQAFELRCLVFALLVG
jgi:hypothetical protein